jgi:hypothetical protein
MCEHCTKVSPTPSPSVESRMLKPPSPLAIPARSRGIAGYIRESALTSARTPIARRHLLDGRHSPVIKITTQERLKRQPSPRRRRLPHAPPAMLNGSDLMEEPTRIRVRPAPLPRQENAPCPCLPPTSFGKSPSFPVNTTTLRTWPLDPYPRTCEATCSSTLALVPPLALPLLPFPTTEVTMADPL